MKSKRKGFWNEQGAFSSNIDALIFLMLVSTAAMILMPSVMAEYQYRSAGYVSIQDTDTLLLASMINCRIDEVSYIYKPTEIIGANVPLPASTVMENAEQTIFMREQKHRTLADLIAEDLFLGLYVEQNKSRTYLNPMMIMHRKMTIDTIQKYLDARLGGVYHYRFEAHWSPVKGHNISSDIVVGDIAPENAIKQMARITLPVTVPLTYEQFYASADESSFQKALNSSDPSGSLHDLYCNSIATLSEHSASLMCSATWPIDRTRTSDRTRHRECDTALLAGPGSKFMEEHEYRAAMYSIDHIANKCFCLDTEVPLNRTIEDAIHDVEDIKGMLVLANSAWIYSCLEQDMGAEIDSTIAEIVNSTDYNTRRRAHDRQMRSIYNRADNGGTEIILFLWH